eukprot:2685186-Ditylum_brightwellii.AAC.1
MLIVMHSQQLIVVYFQQQDKEKQAEKKDININDTMRTIVTSMITDDFIDSHEYDSNLGSDSYPHNEDNKTFDMKEIG